MVVSFVSDRAHRGLGDGLAPQEASRIACDRNAEKECEALAALAPTKVLLGREKAAMGVG